MGMTPETFWGMTLIEWRAALAGYAERNGVLRTQPMSRAELDVLMRRFPDGSA